MGNAWFFTWSTCFLVMETLLWFFADSRGEMHSTLLQKEQEYHEHQRTVLAKSTEMQQHIIDDIELRMQNRDDGEYLPSDVIDEDDYESIDEETYNYDRNHENYNNDVGAGDSFSIQPQDPLDIARSEHRHLSKSVDANHNIGAALPLFEMKYDYSEYNANYFDNNLDDSIRQEMLLKEKDKHAYFETLNDILE